MKFKYNVRENKLQGHGDSLKIKELRKLAKTKQKPNKETRKSK